MRTLFAIALSLTCSAFGQGRLFVNGSSQGYRTTNAPVTFYPITLACWARATSLSVNGTIIYIGSTATGNRTQILFQNTGTFQTQSGPGALYGPTATAVATNVWYHIAAVVTVSGSTMTITQYTNGVATGTPGTGTDAGSDPLWNSFAVGERHNGTSWGTYLSGDVYDACVWSAALDTNELYSLAQGASPAVIRPDSLRGWMKLGERVYERQGGLAITTDGSPTISLLGPPKTFGVR